MIKFRFLPASAVALLCCCSCSMAACEADNVSALYWSAWLCCASGGYEHNSEFSYAGDISKLLFSDREHLMHLLQQAGSECPGADAACSESFTLKDLLRGQKGLEHLRGCVMGFAVLQIHGFYEDALQALSPEQGVM